LLYYDGAYNKLKRKGSNGGGGGATRTLPRDGAGAAPRGGLGRNGPSPLLTKVIFVKRLEPMRKN